MLCTLSTPTYDLDGVMALDLLALPQPDGARRRVNRIATLDGGVAVNDFGFSDADRTLLLRWQPTGQAQHEEVERLVRDYQQLQVATRGAVYLAAPETYIQGADESSLRLLVVEKISA